MKNIEILYFYITKDIILEIIRFFIVKNLLTSIVDKEKITEKNLLAGSFSLTISTVSLIIYFIAIFSF